MGAEALLIESVGALPISDSAERLAAFYHCTLGPRRMRVHEVSLHYGCEIGSLHFAIHPSRMAGPENARPKRKVQ
jgi:hypothetical protein